MSFQLSLQVVPHVSELGFVFLSEQFCFCQNTVCHQNDFILVMLPSDNLEDFITQGSSATTCLTIFGSAFSLKNSDWNFAFCCALL